MSFASGTVSFSRYHVVGGSPKRLDEPLLEKFRSRAIGSRKSARADDEQIGWIGGRHLLDREFAADKNVVLDCLHFGLRIDSSRVPPELMHAYVQMEIEALLKSNGHGGNGYGSRQGFAQLKKEAAEAARGRAAQEIKQGRFRRMRQFPILWDTRKDVLYVGGTQPALRERLAPLFRETFGKRLEPVTAGTLAYRWAESQGATRRIESMAPAKFVPHPSGNGHIDVYWTAGDPASRDYLGNEFLLWLWHTLAEDTDTIRLGDDSEASVVIVRQLTLECPWAEMGKETILCDGPTSLPESRRAIAAGKLPRKAGLMVSRRGEQFEFILQAETLNVSSAALPKGEHNGNRHGANVHPPRRGYTLAGGGNGPEEASTDGRARMEERVELIRDLADTVDRLYEAFLRVRLSDDWTAERERIRAWLVRERYQEAPNSPRP